jgi:L-iditol 2-dehydrogenase
VNQLQITDFPFPEIEDDAILLKLQTCGICGTDLSGIKGKRPQLRFPIIPGHEVIAEVFEIGKNALDRIRVFGEGSLQGGDRVTVNPRIVCGQCYFCRKVPQHPESCLKALTYSSAIGSKDPPHLFGGWAEYMYLLPGSEVIKIPKGLEADIGTMVEPLACAVGCIDRYRREHSWVDGDAFEISPPVVIYGCGAIGMGFVLGFHLANARKIIALDLIDSKLELAKVFGATETINMHDNDSSERIEIIKDMCDGIGAGLIVEACGVPEVLAECVEIARRNARIYELGHLSQAGKAQIDPLKICRNELAILGNYAYPSSNCLGYAAQILAEHKLPYEQLVEIFPLGDYQEIIFGDRAQSVVKAGFALAYT